MTIVSSRHNHLMMEFSGNKARLLGGSSDSHPGPLAALNLQTQCSCGLLSIPPQPLSATVTHWPLEVLLLLLLFQLAKLLSWIRPLPTNFNLDWSLQFLPLNAVILQIWVFPLSLPSGLDENFIPFYTLGMHLPWFVEFFSFMLNSFIYICFIRAITSFRPPSIRSIFQNICWIKIKWMREPRNHLDECLKKV